MIRQITRIKVPMKLALAVFALAVLMSAPLFASAPYVYIAATGAGSQTGLSCANAVPLTFFNNPAMWGPSVSQIGPGTTVHLCGTFTAPGGASGYLRFQGSGVSGAPVTLLMEPGATFLTPWWGVNGAVFGNGQSFIIIDCGVNGTIQATANGTNFPNKQDGAGIDYGEGSNIVVKNCRVGPIYARTGTTDQLGQDTFGIRGGNGVASNNVQVTGNTVTGAKWCIFHSWRAGVATTVLEQDHNVMSNCDHGIFNGTGNTNAVASNIRIHHNRMGSMANWDDSTPANSNHHDAYHINGHQGSSILDLWFYDNVFEGDAGKTTNACFYTYPDPGTYNNWYLFNNVCHNTGADYMANGCFALVNVDSMHILNNTCVSDRATDMNIHYLSSTRLDARNNISKIPALTTFNSGFQADDNTPATMDYNVWNIGSGDFKINGAFYPNLPALRTKFNFEINGTSADALLNTALVPQAGSSAISRGQNLTSVCAAVTPLCSDINGAARPASGLWDAGAFNSGATPPPPVITVTVTPTTVTLGPGGQQQFSSTVTGSSVPPTWTITPVIGTITQNGLYTAATNITTTQAVTVRATVGSVSAAATVTLVPAPPPTSCLAGSLTIRGVTVPLSYPPPC